MNRRHFLQIGGVLSLAPLLPAAAERWLEKENALFVYEAGAPFFLREPFLQKGVHALPTGKDYSELFELFEQHTVIYGLTKSSGAFIAEQLAMAKRLHPLFAARHTYDDNWQHHGIGLKPYRDGEKDHFVWHSWGYKG